MTSFKKVKNAETATRRMKKYVRDKWKQVDLNEMNDDEEGNDTSEVLHVSDLRLALKSLGVTLTHDEVNMLVKGIKEDQEKGVPYEDFACALIFASFFISTFSRQGEGYISAKDLNQVMMSAKNVDTSETDSDKKDVDISDNDVSRRRISQDNKPESSGIDADSNVILDYDNLIKTIEKRRLVFIRAINI